MRQPDLLGEFLRKKRNAIAPETIGLQKPRRSRTPGLRREDVAERANISTVWYAKLERGSAEKVSLNVLLAISDALCCDNSEKQYLLNLAGLVNEPAQVGISYQLPDTSKRLIQHLGSLPALFINDYRDIIYANDAFNLMVGFDVNSIPQGSRNSILLAANAHLWRRWLKSESTTELQDCMQRTAASMRAAMVNRVNTDWEQRLAHLLEQAPMFRQAWEQQNVKELEEIERVYLHHSLGEIMLRKQHWHNKAGEAFGYLMVFIPLNEQDECKLSALF